MLIPHTFDPLKHLYHVEKEYTLATSDIITMAGLNDMSQVPGKQKAFAGHRGTAVHKAIEAYESGESVDESTERFEAETGIRVAEEVTERMKGYFCFRERHEVRVVGPVEKSRVYRHLGTEQLIGTTIDLCAFVDGELVVLDTKTCHKQYGKKAMQLKLKWLCQLQSYIEALEEDDAFWDDLRMKPRQAGKAVLHLHPQCGKVRGQEPAGFEYHRFEEDGQYLWDSCIRLARCKLASGYDLPDAFPEEDLFDLKMGPRNTEQATF